MIRFTFALTLILTLAGIAQAAEPWQAADLNPVTAHAAPAHVAIPLVQNGFPKTVLFIPDKNAPGVAAAVAELQTCIKLAAGVELTEVKSLDDRPALIIGDCAPAKSIGLDSKNCPAEGFAIKTSPGRVFIVGDTATNGLAWGVYEFAERFIGARWYFPGDVGRFVPPNRTLQVPPTWIEDHPAFPMREIWPPCGQPWNGTGTNLTPLQTALRSVNTWPHKLQVHTPNWSGIEDYKQHRPQVFQLTQAGKRDFDMLCYSNPLTLQTYLENIDKAVNHDPSAKIGLVGDTITVCPNDAELACYCPDCRAAWQTSRGEYGSASNVVAGFTARLAAEVKKRWPKMTVLQLAYLNYTDAPTGITFPSNVEAQICGMPGMAMYKEPAIYAHEKENLDQWIKLTGKKVQNWHYSCWPEDKTHAVYAYPHIVQKYYRDNRDKIVGSFINGEHDHWPRQHLSLYCWLKVLWNPDFNVDAAIDAYCRNMYGPAGEAMRELVHLQIDGWENSRWPGGRISSKNIYDISYPPATIARMKSLLADAKQKTSADPIITARLAYFAEPFDAMFREADDVANAHFKPLAAPHVDKNPIIDGKLDDPAWQHAAALSFISAYDREHPQVKYPTTVQALWSTGGVTFAFHMTEPATNKLQMSRTGRDNSTLWWDDNIELLLDVTSKGQGEYYHLIITPANVVADAKGKDFGWNLEGLKTATSIAADHWDMEVFIPFAAFPEAVKPAPGKTSHWLGNFTRHRLADSSDPAAAPGSVPEYQRLNTTYANPSENLSDFGPIGFAE